MPIGQYYVCATEDYCSEIICILRKIHRLRKHPWISAQTMDDNGSIDCAGRSMDCADPQIAPNSTTSDPPVSPEAVLPPEPEPQPCSPEPQPRSPEAAPEPPRSRWSVAANLNSIATRARQVHQRAGSLQLQGNVHFDEIGTTGRRRVPQASERTTTPPQVDTPYVPSGALGDRSAEPLADVVYALQQSVSAMANQMREFLGAGAERTDSRPTASASNSTVTSYPTVTPSTSAAPADEPELTPMRSSRVGCGTVTTYNLTTAMEDIERSTRSSLRATSAFVDTTRWQQRTTAGYASESLPEVETVSPALRSAILEPVSWDGVGKRITLVVANSE